MLFLDGLAGTLTHTDFLATFYLVTDTSRLVGMRTDHHDVRDMDRSLFLDALTFFTLATSPYMTLHDTDALNHDLFGHGQHEEYFSLLATVLAGHDLYFVAFLDLHRVHA